MDSKSLLDEAWRLWAENNLSERDAARLMARLAEEEAPVEAKDRFLLGTIGLVPRPRPW